MSRATDLENAVEKLLKIKNLEYMRVSNYRCFNCGQVQNASAKGWPDFFIFYPFMMAIECKTGKGKLTKEQQSIRESFIRNGIAYVVVRDTVDDLIQFLNEPRSSIVINYSGDNARIMNKKKKNPA